MNSVRVAFKTFPRLRSRGRYFTRPTSQAGATNICKPSNFRSGTSSFAVRCLASSSTTSIPTQDTSSSSNNKTKDDNTAKVSQNVVAAAVGGKDEDTASNTTTITPMNIIKKEVKVSQEKPWLWDMGLPSLVPDWRRMLDTKTLFTDVSAGITIGCIAVPLSLAIAVASGVPPEVGLTTAAVSGVAGGLMGGTTLAITGPAAAISLLVVGAVTEHGFQALPFITLSCGALQVISGVTRLGVMAKLVPVSVIAGFTTGVGAMILSGQIPKALGLSAPAGMNPIETMLFIGDQVSNINPSSAALALSVSAAMFLLPKVHPKMPSALLAVGGATLATQALGLDVTLIGSIPSGLEAFQWAMPVMPPMESLPSLGASIFLIYAMTSAESLLSCAALDKMKKTPYQYNPDQELVGQGLANVGAGLFTGMPVTSVIARSGLNVKLGANTRLPALVQSGFVFSSVVFFSETIATIPMPALSGMLITTGVGMLSPAEFKHCFAIQKLDVIPFVTTIGGMIAFGLAEGIGIGCLSAWALNFDYGKMEVQELEFPHKEEIVDVGYFNPATGRKGEAEITVKKEPDAVVVKQLRTENVKLQGRVVTLQTDNAKLQGRVVTLESENTHLRERLEAVEMENEELRGLFHELTAETLDTSENLQKSRSTIGWQLKGPINFASMFKIDDLIARIQEMKTDEKVIVLDMQETTSVEFTGVEELVNRLVEVAEQNPGTTIQMWNCHTELQNALQQCDPTERIARHCSTTSHAAPFQFPPKEEKEVREAVPTWYDSPHFRPDP